MSSETIPKLAPRYPQLGQLLATTEPEPPLTTFPNNELVAPTKHGESRDSKPVNCWTK
jgi:hypothetical protein